MGKLELISLRIALSTLLFVVLACATGDSLPTLVPTAAVPTTTPPPTVVVPTTTPMPVVTFSIHQNVDSLVRSVLGSRLASFDYEEYTEYRGQQYPDGRVGYHLDLSVTLPERRSRVEMLQIAYTLMSELHYNYSENLMFASANLRSHANDVVCVIGFGVGYQAAIQYLPSNQPSNLDAWFAALVQSNYYGDLPGETEALIAHGNDPRYVTSCDLEQWKK